MRRAFKGGIRARYFGHVPLQYADLPHFAVVREPKDRFLSAFRMFKYGDMLEGEYYSTPRFPDLTISQALDILEDPWVGYDRSQRNVSWNLKHHLIPQTHPFNSLALATSVLRFEELDDDFPRLCDELGVSAELPRLRQSINHDSEIVAWTANDVARFDRIFGEDYRRLGYSNSESPQKITHDIDLDNADTASKSVFALWSAYFSDRKVFAENATEALPTQDCSLEPFADEIIPGHPGPTWAGRSKDLNDHFHKLQPEFSGASRLSHLLACTIVVLRKAPDCEDAKALFWRILDTQFDVIRSELSLRWLVAISDTIVDFGRDAAEAAIGMNASILANTTKLHESELKVFYPKRPWPPKKRVTKGGKLFDGMLTFWTEQGDLVDNMFGRAEKTAELSPSAGKVLIEVIERLRKGPTVYRRFERVSGNADIPLLDDKTKRRLQDLMDKKL